MQATAALEPCEADDMSRSESESGSASRHQDESGQPFEDGEASTSDEDTGKCSHSALRGEREQRVSRERSRNLRGPACGGIVPEEWAGIHNRLALHGRESEEAIVAGKRGNSRGAKGLHWQYAESETWRTACEK